MRPMARPAALILIAMLLAGPAAAGQVAPPARPAAPAPPPRPALPDLRASDANASDTREKLQEILRQYPPSLSQVLRLDPSLLSDATYLAPYPFLAAYLADHPEVAHNPSFFIGDVVELSPSGDAARAVRDVFGSLFVLTGFMSFFSLVAWIAKMISDHRKWLRTSKVQTETHTKILDRLTSSEELIAYTQTPAGRRFLEAAPMMLDGPRAIGAPVGRILWSMQAGSILSLVGAGFLFLSNRIGADGTLYQASPFLFIVGVVILAAGAGFLVSAALAYVVSRHLKLFEAPKSSHA